MLFYFIPEYSHLGVFFCFCCFLGFFGYCLFNEVLAEGTAPGVWNFPSAPASHALCFLWACPRGLQLEQLRLSPFPVLLRLLLHWPL